MKERAQRERRNFTKVEEMAAKFPTKSSCPLCWLDEDMNNWDSIEVYRFLKERYWPGGVLGVSSSSSSSTLLSSSLSFHAKKIHSDMSMEGQPISRFGLYCTITPFVVIAFMFVKQYFFNRGMQMPMRMGRYSIGRKNKSP
jgi:hypothetical protein